MKKFFVDVSHILKQDMHAAKKGENSYVVEFEGKQERIPSHKEAVEYFYIAIRKALKDCRLQPSDVVLVKDGIGCKKMRRKFLPDYCVRDPGPPEFMDEFNKALEIVEETMLSYGAISVEKNGVEADDIIAALAKVYPDHYIWSGDKDMLAAGRVYYKGEVDPDKFLGLTKNRITLYKSLVGDQSDKIPGAKGFGEKAFIDMVVHFGEDACDDFLELLEDGDISPLEDFVDECKPLKKVIADPDTVINSYLCAKFHHPGFQDLQWKMSYHQGNGVFKEWEPSKLLVTQNLLTDDLISQIGKEMRECPFVSFDIETDTCEESKEWSLRNKSKSKKKSDPGPLDIYGSEVVGFSLTIGSGSKKTYYFPVQHKETDNISFDEMEVILNMFPEDRPIVIHNSQFELPVIRKNFELRFHKGYLPKDIDDTLIMAMCVDEYEPVNLKDCSKRTMGYNQTTYEELLDGRSGMFELTGQEAFDYGCDDTICTASLYRLYHMIMQFEGTWDAYAQTDKRVMHMYAESHLTGVRFDLDTCRELQSVNKVKYNGLWARIQDFLEDLTWEEPVEKESEIPERVTADNLLDVLAKADKQFDEGINGDEFEMVKRHWPGTVFEPAEEFTPAEVKRLHLVCTGRVLKTGVRLPAKLAKAAQDLVTYDDPDQAELVDKFAKLVKDEDLKGLNALAESLFIPDPILNLRSPDQMTRLLYDALGFEVRLYNKLTDKQREEGRKKGNPSSDGDAIAHAIAYDADPLQREFLKNILDAKSCLTEDSLFFTPYQQMPHWEDGYVHPKGGLAMAKSGRPTSSEPNFSQVSKKSPVRRTYVPLEDDEVFVSFDIAGQELVHTAVRSMCKDMLSCYTGKVRRDIHSVTGTSIFNMRNESKLTYDEFMAIRKDEAHPLHEVIGKTRTDAKPVNFLDLYLGTSKSLAVDLLITEEEAQAMLDAKGEAFPGVRAWQERCKVKYVERGYSETPLGRRRHLRLDGSWKDNHEIRGGVNHEIQGGAAEQLKLILATIWEGEILDEFLASFLFSVYDEVNFSVPRIHVIPFVKRVHPIVTQPFCNFPVDFESSIEIGPDFGQLVKIGTTVDEAKIEEVLAAI